MKILHIQETLAPNFGGPSKLLPQLARAQAAAGLEVEILTTNADVAGGTYRASGVELLPDSQVTVNYFETWPTVLRYAAGLGQFLRDNASRFDLLHIHGLYRYPQSYGAYFARSAGIPYVISPHGALDPYLYARSAYSLPLKRLYERFVDLPNLRAASAIHFTTEDERKRTSYLNLKTRSFIVPVGIDWSQFAMLPQQGAFRKRLGLDDRPIVLFLGRLHHKKGLDILIDAFNIVCRHDERPTLVIVGPEAPGYGNTVRRRVAMRGLKDRVIFAGPLYDEEVLEAYVDSDVFALPSYTENFGISVVEAMASAMPVLISDQVNIHDEVSAVGAGLATRCDVGEVATALSKLLSSPELRRACGAAGRALVQQRFTWPSIVQALQTEYENVLYRCGADVAAAAR